MISAEFHLSRRAIGGSHACQDIDDHLSTSKVALSLIVYIECFYF